MRPFFRACQILLALSLAMASPASPLWPDYIEEGQTLGWEQLDRLSLDLHGVSFHQYMAELPASAARISDDAAGRALMDQHVSHLIVGDNATRIALYTAFAEEASFRLDTDGVLRIQAFNGMNVSHRVVRAMLEELMAGVTVSPDGRFSGVGHLFVDIGSEHNGTQVTVDFDRGTITPSLEVTDDLGMGGAVTVDDVTHFVRWFFPLADLGGDSIAIFVNMPDLPTIRHELMHALFAADQGYRQQIKERAASATLEQREMAILFAAVSYDIFDPDMADRNPYIVLDEVFNAYKAEGMLDLTTGRSRMSAGAFLRTYGLEVSLGAYEGIDSLPVQAADAERLGLMYDYFMEASPTLTERAFFDAHTNQLMDNIYCLRFLRNILMQQHPEFYARVIAARRALVDQFT